MARRPIALDLFRLAGVARQHAVHVHAPACAGLHERVDSPRGESACGCSWQARRRGEKQEYRREQELGISAITH